MSTSQLYSARIAAWEHDSGFTNGTWAIRPISVMGETRKLEPEMLASNESYKGMKLRSTVLVAEDDAQDAFLLKRAFLKAGINTTINFVRDGQEVIDYLEGKKMFADRKSHPFPNLLLLDLKMPRLDGFDVLLWLRNQTGLKRLITVVLTTSTLPTDVNRAYDLGANSYLVKSELGEFVRLAQVIRDYWLEANEEPDCQSQACR